MDESSPSGTSHCVYAEHLFSWEELILSATVVALVTALFNIPLDWVFELIYAPTADDMKVKNDENSVIKRVGRRLSNVATSGVNRVRRASAIFADAASKALKRHEVTAGDVTRHIPHGTHEAHSLAAQSLKLVQPVLARNLLLKQENRTSLYSRATAAGNGKSFILSEENINGTTTPQPQQTLDQQAMSRYKQLCQDIVLQRQLLKPSEVNIFDLQWSIACHDEELNQFQLDRITHVNGNHIHSNEVKHALTKVEECILNEIYSTINDAGLVHKRLKYATDEHIGLEILHLFIKDILGKDTPAAKIFSSKTDEDFNHTLVVTASLKAFLVLVIILVDMFFV